MNKISTVMLSGTLLISLPMPIYTYADEEIHLAAAIGASPKPADKTQESSNSGTTSNSAIGGGAVSGAGEVAGTASGMSVGVMVAIGAGVAGLVVAAGKTESTSNH